MNLTPATGEDFKRIEAAEETCIIVFSKDGCKVCARLEPTMDKIAADYKDSSEVRFYSMNVLEPSSRALFKSWQLVGVPQTALIKDGEFREALPGAIDEGVLRKEIKHLINPPQGFMAKLKGIFG